MKSTFFSFLSLLLLSACSESGSPERQQPVFSFGIIADAQYADKEPAGLRYYRSSLNSLDSAARDFNSRDISFAVHLGDIIDEDFSSYGDILPIYNQIKSPRHIVLGNHEFSVKEEEKARVLSTLGLEQRYYDFVVDRWRFIALDGQGMSTFAPVGGDSLGAQNMLRLLREQGARNAFEWNGGIDSTQMEWLKERLDLATQDKQSVILFCHFPTYPFGEMHNLWNDEIVVQLIEAYPVVKAWFNGHNHAGFTGIRDGIHFLTLKGMVNHPQENSYAIAHVYEDHIVVEGIGAEDTRIIPIRGVYGEQFYSK